MDEAERERLKRISQQAHPTPHLTSAEYSRGQTINRIDLWSSYKIGCLMWMIPTVVCGLCGWLVRLVLVRILLDVQAMLIYAVIVIIALVVGGSLVGLGAVVWAALYNLVAHFFGGLHIRLGDDLEHYSAPGPGTDLLALIAAPALTCGAIILLWVTMAGGVAAMLAPTINSAVATAQSVIPPAIETFQSPRR